MSSAYDQVLSVLEPHLTRLSAQGLIDAALRRSGLTAAQFTPRQLPQMLPRILRGVKPLVSPDVHSDIRRRLMALEPAPEYVPPDYLQILEERDISTARNLARTMCERMGAGPLLVQKIATIVSELARNIVSYTPGGAVELLPSQLPPPRMVIRAIDKGSGINNLDEVLSGRYRSRTGLGMGLLGTKRLADRFDVRTGLNGTRVEAEIYL